MAPEKGPVQPEQGYPEAEPRPTLHWPRQHTAEHVRVGEVVQGLELPVGRLKARGAALQLAHKQLEILHLQALLVLVEGRRRFSAGALPTWDGHQAGA